MSDESLLQFPCEFPIKIMGTNTPDFRNLVTDLIRRHVIELDETRIQVRDSSAGRYQSLTVVVDVHSRAQLDAIYRELSGHPDITMVL
ncbi:MAG: DUF493 domain-containing protein [Phycisphaerales bacterium]|nr:DUF493 domain-containing protein [Phycisphaerales bacterium]